MTFYLLSVLESDMSRFSYLKIDTVNFLAQNISCPKILLSFKNVTLKNSGICRRRKVKREERGSQKRR